MDNSFREALEKLVTQRIEAGADHPLRDGDRVRLVGEGLLLADQVGGDYLEAAL